MASVLLAPSAIYFSQDSISNRFGQYTPHRNKTIGETLDDILSGKCKVSDLPTISVIKKNGFWVSADNRRLWVYKKLQAFGKCDAIPAVVTYRLSELKNCIQSTIRVRGQEGGTIWKNLVRMQKSGSCDSSRENSNLPKTIASYTPNTLQSGASGDSNPVSNLTLKQTSKETSLMMSSFADFSVGRIQAFGNDDNEHRPKTSSFSAEHTATDRYPNENSRMKPARKREMPSTQTIRTSYTRSAAVLRKTIGNDDNEHPSKTSTSSSAEHTGTEKYLIENSRMGSAREREMSSNSNLPTTIASYTLNTLQSGASVDSNPKLYFTLKTSPKDTSLMMSLFTNFVGRIQAFGNDDNEHRPKTSTSSSAEHTATDRYPNENSRMKPVREREMPPTKTIRTSYTRSAAVLRKTIGNDDNEHPPKTLTSSSAERTGTERYLTENSRMGSAREKEMPSTHIVRPSFTRQTGSAVSLRKTTVSQTCNREYSSHRTQPSNPEYNQPSTREIYSREDDSHSIESEKQSSDIKVNKINQPPSYPQNENVNLNPLDVGFAGLLRPDAFDGEQIGEYLDKFLLVALDISITFPLKVFQYKGKYYSEKSKYLWIIQSLQRISGNIKISGQVVPSPTGYWIPRDTLLLQSFSKVKGEHWKNKQMLDNLPTKKGKPLTLTDILYSTAYISDAFKGRSIIREAMQVYSSGRHNHELNVVEYNGKFYALQNEKLWVLKQVEVVLGPLKVTGNVKVCMDDIMFHSFASDNIRSVDIIMTGIEHTEEEKFMLEYIKKNKEILMTLQNGQL
ncbi:uncharacterized protein LOC144625593 [Crassostrea virginica]